MDTFDTYVAAGAFMFKFPPNNRISAEYRNKNLRVSLGDGGSLVVNGKPLKDYALKLAKEFAATAFYPP